MKIEKLEAMTLTKVVKACLIHNEHMRNPYLSTTLKDKHRLLNKICYTIACIKFESLSETDKFRISLGSNDIRLSLLFQSRL